jgi:glyoxylase-like metal-dependent hydrolase (beta-lactamase superfamily II)
MQRLLLSIVVTFVHTYLFGQGKPPLLIQHLTDNFYVYTTYKPLANRILFPSNSLYLVTDAGVVLFDTPWDLAQFQPLLDSIAVKHQKNVILALTTHYHNDRTAGLSFLNQLGIPTYTSKYIHDLCATFGEKQAAFYFENDTVLNIGGYQF